MFLKLTETGSASWRTGLVRKVIPDIERLVDLYEAQSASCHPLTSAADVYTDE